MSRPSAGLQREVRLGVPPTRTFAAVGTLTGIRGWWTSLVSGSAKPGGLLTLRFRGLDEQIRFRVEQSQAPHSARWLCLGHSSLEDWAGTRLSFTIKAVSDAASSLQLFHEGLVPALACFASCRAGWDHFLESLVAWAETGRGEPFGAHPKMPRKIVDGVAAYAALAHTFEDDPRVTLPAEKRGKFGSNGLRVDGKIFAMWVRGKLVVKLPEREIDDAVAAKRGERLLMGRKRVMREWLVVEEAQDRWASIVNRARAFVGRMA